MNILPEILRQSHAPTVYRRQGPQYLLRLGSLNKRTPVSTERGSVNAKTQLKVNRYSIDKSDLESRRTINYSTISYDHRNDPEFYGTRGKKDQVESYQILVQERLREASIVEMKVDGLKGTKEQYLGELKVIQDTFSSDLKAFESSFQEEIIKLRHFLSELRRETQAEIRSFKQDLKQQNQELIVYCQQLKKIDGNFKKVKQNLESI